MEGRTMTPQSVYGQKLPQAEKPKRKMEKLRELNTHFIKLQEILGTAKDAEDAESGLKALTDKGEGKAKVISQRIKKYMDSLIAAYIIEGAPQTIVDVEKFQKEAKSPVRRGNRFAFEAHGARVLPRKGSGKARTT